MKKNYKFGVGAVLLVAAIGYLMYAGVEQSSSYYFTIEEFLPKMDTYAERGVRVAGRVAVGSLQKKTSAAGTEMKFHIGDFTDTAPPGAPTLPVEYTGIVPDMFAEGRDVIVEGTYTGGVLQASAVMTSCPSKYEPEAEGARADNRP
jgi:cytochrome c-type biogenesis protein CcmE